ncbi:MAG TPA: FAD-binding oxidoreductase [Bryobacteraceae bacterium]|nr:FAD-binding oxidoreductase [Bryobacteraceae bacterium]
MIAKLLRYNDLAPDIRHFVFEVPEVSVLPFQPGQFASLCAVTGGKEITRAYSLAGEPRGDNQFEICLNRVPDGIFSPFLFDLQPGDPVTLKGILGTFGWREPAMDSILVATGTGIVPYKAMLNAHFLRTFTRQITLIYGTRHAKNLLWTEYYRSLEASFPQFRFLQTVTRPEENWTGLTSRVQPILLETLGERKDMQVYVCGLKEMVDSVRALCKERGLERRQIIYEKYD